MTGMIQTDRDCELASFNQTQLGLTEPKQA